MGGGVLLSLSLRSSRSWAEVAEIAVGHWWPVEDPRPAAAALIAFWSRLDRS